MSKPFLSYTDQLHKLEFDKGLIVSNKVTAENALKNLSYYALIGGYKQPFIDIHTRKYVGNTTFEDIVALQQYDEELRELFFKYLCRVEQKMRSLISYHFTMQYGESQTAYLTDANYNNTKKYHRGIQKLINMLSNNTYLTIPNMNLHQKLKISKTGTTYNKGKEDLFAVVIGLRYLLDRDEFAVFKKKLIAAIKGYGKKSNRLTENELLELMGFPIDWKNISRYRL